MLKLVFEWLIMLLYICINNQISSLLTLSENEEMVLIWFDLIFLNQIFCFILIISGNHIPFQLFIFFKICSG